MRLSLNDRTIIEVLRENSRRTNTEVAFITGLSRTTVRQRIKRLIQKGIIQRFTIDVELDPAYHPIGLRAMFDVRLRRSNTCGPLFASISGWDELVACWSLAGSTDMRVMVEVANQKELDRLRDRLARHPEVGSLSTASILKTWCERVSGIHETVPEDYVITRKGKKIIDGED
ncbi:MAG: Lrp/AsnC family transcriptional regulator [Pseudomonadota bacterium]